MTILKGGSDLESSAEQSDFGQKPLSKAEYVLQRLRKELQSGEILPGAQIRQTEISVRYGVSATPVREAMRRLESEGLINYSPHRGATVAEMSGQDLRDLYLFRAEVEGFLARLATERADRESLAMLRKLQNNMRDLVNQGASAATLSRQNREFHLALMQVGSPYVADQVMRPLWEKAIPSSESMWDSRDHVDRFLEEHEAVLSAMEAGQPEEASRHMAEHVLVAFNERQVRSGRKGK